VTGSRRPRERGQSAVEFAIICQVFFLLVFGIYQVGTAYFDNLTLHQAVRDGARKAQVNRSLPASQVDALARQEVLDTASHLDPSKLTISIRNLTNPGSATWSQGDQVEVDATYPWSISLFGLVSGGGTWDAKTTVRME
jgi:Flp pilus assembly protein TadG